MHLGNYDQPVRPIMQQQTICHVYAARLKLFTRGLQDYSSL